MSAEHLLSVHIDMPQRLRVQGMFCATMQEVTRATASTFGTAMLGLHRADESRFVSFGSPAHQRGPDLKFLQPANQNDRLFDEEGRPLPDAVKRYVSGMVLNATGRRADVHGGFALSPARFADVQQFIAETAANPPPYHTYHSNCVKFVRAALEVGGVTLDTSMLPPSVARLRRPEDIATALAHQPQRGDAQFYIAQPRLLGR